MIYGDNKLCEIPSMPLGAWMIFMACSKAAAQMTLIFITLQYLLYTVIQCAVLLFQTLCQIFMDCRFTNSELFCGIADGCTRFCDILT